MSGSQYAKIASLDLGFEVIDPSADQENSSETLTNLGINIGFGIDSVTSIIKA